ncbi:uncharacterized protein LOC115695012 [Cannabis sativa]|uniref:uncharacterized protein LOC115695012 n=1 Tax=Cannabis sativa TaxID=3483 RepID=UPI0029CA43EC|nr:uncharacterized protein LOC115695012 [Cannabis sativa]
MVRTRVNSSVTSTDANDNPVVDAPSNIAPPPLQTSTHTIPKAPASAPQNHSALIDRPAYEDVRSPYYLSTAGHPGLALATLVLTNHNFQPWKRDFKILIGAHNKTPFLDNSLPKPPPQDPLLSSSIRCNQMVQSWILHSVSPKIRSSIMYLDTTLEMWSELHNRFNQGNSSCIFKLNETLTFLHQGDDSVSAYFTRLTAIWDEINQLHPKVPCTCLAAAKTQEYLNNDQVL